jgi:hypothetical protein
MVAGSITSDVTGDFFRDSFRQNHVSWGRLSLWKWVPGISPGVKVAGAYGWRPTTLVVPNVEMIWGLNLPGTPKTTSACRGTPLLYFTVRGWVDPRVIERQWGLCQWKIPMIEPATFRLVAQCLIQLRYRVPLTYQIPFKYTHSLFTINHVQAL